MKKKPYEKKIKDMPLDTSLDGLMVFNRNQTYFGTITIVNNFVFINYHTFLGRCLGHYVSPQLNGYIKNLKLFGINYLDCINFNLKKMERMFIGRYGYKEIKNKNNYLSYVVPTIKNMRYLIKYEL